MKTRGLNGVVMSLAGGTVVLLWSAAGFAQAVRATVFGTWDSKIKSSDPNLAGGDHGADAIPLTRQALENTGQNLFVYRAYEAISEDRTVVDPFYLDTFENDVLPTFEGSTVNVLAQLDDHRNLMTLPAVTYPDWTQLADYLGDLSEGYSNFIGFTIDDFQEAVCLGRPRDIAAAEEQASNGVTCMNNSTVCCRPEDVRNIRLAGNAGGTRDFAFVPYMAAEYAGVLIPEGFVLGAQYGTPIYLGDEISREITFSLPQVPPRFIVSFLHWDNNEQDDRDCQDSTERQRQLDLVVSVNGVPVWRDSLWDSICQQVDGAFVTVENPEYIEMFRRNIRTSLRTGMNTLKISVEATGLYANPSRQKLAHLWDFEILTGGPTGPLSLFDESLWNSDEFHASQGELVAQTNQNTRIADGVDGLMVHYREDPRTLDLAVYRRFMHSLRQALDPGKPVWACPFGFDFGDEWDHDLGLHQQFLDISAIEADGIVAFRHPLELYAPDQGIFTKRVTSATAPYDVVTYWPAHTPHLPGWFQEFTTIDAFSGEVRVTVSDNRTIDPKYLGWFLVEVFRIDSSGAEILVDRFDPAATPSTDAPQTHVFVLTASEASRFRLRMRLTGTGGSLMVKAFMRVSDALGHVLAGPDDYEFKSALFDEAQVQSMYDLTAARYLQYLTGTIH